MEIIWSILAIGGLGAAFGILLSVASKKLAVKKDEKVVAADADSRDATVSLKLSLPATRLSAAAR